MVPRIVHYTKAVLSSPASRSGKLRLRAAQVPCQGRRSGLGDKVGFELPAPGAPQPGGLTENLEGSGKLTFLAPGPPAGTMMLQLCGRRVGSLGARLSRSPPFNWGRIPCRPASLPPCLPAAPRSQDVGWPESRCPRPQPPPRHAPPGRAATAGLSTAQLPRLSTLRLWPRRVSGGPA